MIIPCTVSPPLLVKEQGSALPNKPFHLGLSQAKKKSSNINSNPGSPTCNVTITPADEAPKKLSFDSGNNSMTNSDASGHSAHSELYSGSPMINLDSPIGALSKDVFQLAEFDPLIIRQSISHDSLLFDSYHPQSSRDSTGSSARLLPASPAPCTPSQNIVQRQQSQQSAISTSPRSNQSSPRESLSTIALPRPRPRGRSDPVDPGYVASAPASRSQSPKPSRERCPDSPTGSIKSQQYYSTWDDDHRPSCRFDSTSDFGDLVDLDLVSFNLDDEGPNLLLDFKLADL